jgi:hypothetical protein
MVKSEFAAILIGASKEPRYQALSAEIRRRTAGLAAVGERLDILPHGKIDTLPAATRAVAAILCRTGMRPAELDGIATCLKREIPIFPVVEDLGTFTTVAPAIVSHLNGFELPDDKAIGELSGLLLESLGLQRAKRKIFISYARADAKAVAQQLREAFAARWYSVFLDTVSIRPGEPFQDELLQELADSDVMLLLNSPSIKNRPYVQKEVSFADQANVGGVQVVWPDVEPLREGGFFMPVRLDEVGRAEMENGRVRSLTPSGIAKILQTVADLRTELQNQREDEVVRPIEAYARAKNWDAVCYPGRFIELRKGKDRVRLDVALGLPNSHDLERAFRNALPADARIVYDPLGITDKQADHIAFLGSKLPVQFLDYKAAPQWDVIP